MPRRNPRAPTNQVITIPRGIVNIDLNQATCGFCHERIVAIDETRVVFNNEGIQTWHEHPCYEQHSFHCVCCGDDYNMNIEHTQCHNENICVSCADEYYGNCDHCENLEHADEISNVVLNNDESESWCHNCRDNGAVFDQFEENWYQAGGFTWFPIAGGGHVTHITVDNNPTDFVRCTGSDRLIYLRREHSYFQHEGSIICIEFARNNGIPIPERIRGNTYDAGTFGPRLEPNNIRQNRGNINSQRETLKHKVINQMTNRPSPNANPYHDRIFLGLELEAQAGHYFIDAPHRMLHKELPETLIVRDGSIYGEGWEFLPPIIKKRKDWEKIEKLITTLKDFKWSADQSCGLHLHLSHGMLSSNHPEIVRNIFRMFYWLEPIIFNCLPLERRNNKYCYPISKYFDEKDMGQDLKLDYWYYSNFWKKRIRRQDGNNRQPHYRFDNAGRTIDTIEFGEGPYKKQNMEIDKNEHYYVGRYIGCNLHALFQKGTLELRYFPAVLDYTYIRNWSEIITRIVTAGIEGTKIEPIIEMSKGRGNMEKAIKDMVSIFKLPASLGTFLKLEYRKYRDKPDQETPERETLVPFTNAQTNYRQFAQRTEQQTRPRDEHGRFRPITIAPPTDNRIRRPIDPTQMWNLDIPPTFEDAVRANFRNTANNAVLGDANEV